MLLYHLMADEGVLPNMPAGSLCPECAQRLEETVHGKQETPWQKIEQPKQERLIPWWYDL